VFDEGLQVPVAHSTPTLEVSQINYDGFGRPIEIYRPDPGMVLVSEATPSVVISYTDASPISQVKTSARMSATQTLTSYDYMDGLGVPLLHLAPNGVNNWIATGLEKRDVRGSVVGSYRPWAYVGSPTAYSLAPPRATPDFTFVRDVIDRVTSTKARAPNAVHVLDRFHVAKLLGEAVDKVRREEAHALRKKGKPPALHKARWLFLRNKKNLKGEQRGRLRELVKTKLRAVRAYILKEEFRHFWTYGTVLWAARFFDRWCTMAMRSKLEPMKKVVKTLRRHRTLILNWIKAKKTFAMGARASTTKPAPL
jgi:hypothetical protein